MALNAHGYFNCLKSYLYCLEFKAESIQHDVPDQLKVSVDWLKTLHATINAYSTKRSAIHATNYVLSNGPAARSHDTPLPLCQPQWYGTGGFGQQ